MYHPDHYLHPDRKYHTIKSAIKRDAIRGTPLSSKQRKAAVAQRFRALP